MKREILVIGLIILFLGLIISVTSFFFIFETAFRPSGVDGLILILIGAVAIMMSFIIPKDEFLLKESITKSKESCFASEIINIRLAKGEITDKEYEEIARKINKDYIDFEVFSKSKYQNMIDFLLNMYRDQGFKYPEYQLQQKIREKMSLGKSRVDAIEELNEEELKHFS